MKSKLQFIVPILILVLLIISPTLLQVFPQNQLLLLPAGSSPQTQPKTGSIPPQDAPPWWNTTFKYRIPVNVSVSTNANATIPVDVYVDFQALGVSCHRNSLRVQFWDGSSWLPGQGIPYQLWNETLSGNYVLRATITFHANVTAYKTTTYYIYFSNTSTDAPSFTPQVNATVTGSVITINGRYYKAYINTTAYGGKIFDCYNTFSGGNWSLRPFHFGPSFTTSSSIAYHTSGTPSNISLDYSSGPLFVMVTSSTRFSNATHTVNTYANVTYRFFEWGWICNTTTVFQESYSISVYRSLNYSFPAGIMPVLYYKGGEQPIVMSTQTRYYYLTMADWFCTLNENNGIAAGMVNVVSPKFNVTSPQSVYWRFTVIYRSDYERYIRRTVTSMTVSPGNSISECYAFYVWNGTRGYKPFVDFAEAMSNNFVEVSNNVEQVFYVLKVHVRDGDNYPLSGALVEIKANGASLINKTTDQDGNVSFYLYGGNYIVRVSWNETHGGVTYRTYINSTLVTLEGHKNVTVEVGVVNLICHVVYPTGNDLPSINVTVFTTDGELFVSGLTNGTGCIHFRLPPAIYVLALYDDYGNSLDIRVNGTQNRQVNLSSGTPCYVEINCTEYALRTMTYVYAVDGIAISKTWTPGTFKLKVLWMYNGTTPVNRSEDSSRYLKYKIVDASSMQTVLDWKDLEQCNDEGIYYVADLTGLLFGGTTYLVYFRAGGQGFVPVTNYTTIIVHPVALNDTNVQTSTLIGIYYWNHTDITVWVSVYDNCNGFPVVSANVTCTIENLVVFQLSHSGNGNYTATIPKDLLSPGSYTITFRVECTNYTAYEKVRLNGLTISPRPIQLVFKPYHEVFFGDEFTLYVYCVDDLTKAPLRNATVMYSIEEVELAGSLYETSDGNYTTSFATDLLPADVRYLIRLDVSLANYSSVRENVWLYIKPIPMEIKSSVSETRWKETLNLTVTVWDTHNNVPVADAEVSCTILKDGMSVLTATLTPLGNGTYVLSIDTHDMLPGKYTVVFRVYKGNYSAQPRQVDFEIKRIATSLTPTSFTVLGGFTPYLVLSGGYGEVENSVPFVVLVFEYRDAYGNPIPGATVTTNGVPLTYIGDGRYILVVPTGIPPSTLPFVISASAENYESAQSFQVLTVKERGVTIPGLNIRVPLTMFAVLSLAVISPPASLASYVYVRRLRTPPVIRKIDSLIEAIEKGKPFEVKKPLTRTELIKSLLMEELAVVGVEPRVEAYVPAEVFSKLLPLLAEIGLSEDVAVTLLKELKANPPVERERLLASIGVPPDISAIILEELEKEEERKERREGESREEGESPGRPDSEFFGTERI